MDKILHNIPSFFNNPWMTAVTAILTLLGFFLTIFFYFKSSKTKIPSYYLRSVTFGSGLRSRFSKLAITYDGKEIERLTITRIMFINLGNDIINRTDIASLDPLKVSLSSNFEIFQTESLYVKNQANDFNITHHDNEVFLTFDYLAESEGGVFQIVHTGINDDITVSGTIKGINSLLLLKADLAIIRTKSSTALLLVIMMTLSLIFCAYILWMPSLSNSNFLNGIYVKVITFVLSFLYWASFVFPILINKRMYGRVKEYFSVIEQPWTA